MSIEDEILRKLAALQVRENNRHFPTGSFSCYRENQSLNYRRPDNNVFGTASTVFILKEIRSLLSKNNQRIVDEIIEQAVETYPLYKNKDGLSTYNFWQTQPSQHFPHGHLLKRFQHFKLPDDIDDTALIYLTKPHSQQESRWLKEKLTQHTTLENEPKNYIYSTWFGKSMPIEQDVCALCNLMYWVFENDFPLNEHDEATLNFLKQKITSGDFLKYPFQTARHYATIPLILYHYARLINKFDVSQLVDCKSIIVKNVEKLLSYEVDDMDKTLLSTALLKLSPESRVLQGFSIKTDVKADNFYSFIGAFLGPYVGEKDSFLKQRIEKYSSHPLTRFNWKCEGHELALRLENVVLRSKSC